MPCRESLGIVYLVGIGKGIRVRGYGGEKEGEGKKGKRKGKGRDRDCLFRRKTKERRQLASGGMGVGEACLLKGQIPS